MNDSRALIDDSRWVAALIAGVALVLLVNPIGFIGGGLDDWQYLNAARCWREFGPCLPHDHWQARWPVIAPIAAFTTLFGETRATVGAMPLLESLICLFLIAAIGNRLFKRPVGWIAALLMLATPNFAIQLLEPSVESVELGFVLAGFLSLLVWEERRKWYLSLLAGLFFSLAIQVRETAAAAALFAYGYLIFRKSWPRISHLVWAGAGFALPFGVEFLVFWISTGDPFWRVDLDLHHTLIPSSELEVTPDPNHSPLFNKTYIANWKRVPGIHVWWAVDGLLNLFANAESGLSLIFVPLLALFAREPNDRSFRRSAMILWLIALGYASALIYAFAIDPKPRMMFVSYAMTNIAFALLSYRLLQRRRAIVQTMWIASAGVMLFLVYGYPSDLMMEPAARRWIAELPGQIEIDGNTRRHLALVPETASLPGVDSDRPYLLYRSIVACETFISWKGLPPRTFSIAAEAPASHLEWLDMKLRGPLCLLHYDHQISGDAFREAFRRSRNDGNFMVGTRAL
jgi:Dolichyl-phosphate-mannose-protein mannosyltransferase